MGVLTYDLLAKDICYVCVIFTVFESVGRGAGVKGWDVL